MLPVNSPDDLAVLGLDIGTKPGILQFQIQWMLQQAPVPSSQARKLAISALTEYEWFPLRFGVELANIP